MRNLFKPKQTVLALAMVLAPALIYGQARSGTLDGSFGTGGKVTTDFVGSGDDDAAAVAVQLDGKLVAAGQATINGGLDFALARYSSNGTLDAGFGRSGKVTTDFGSIFERATSVAVQRDGKVVAAGGAVINSFNDFALARYNSNGTLDTSFGTGGKVITDFEGVSAEAYSVAVQTDGKIVVAGEANIDGGDDFALVRYNSNGTLDTTFGTGGKVTTDFGLLQQGFSYALAYSLAVQPDGKLVVAGQASINGVYDFALARYNSNGTVDTTFGTDGKVTTNFASPFDGAFSVAVQPDGKIVAAGFAFLNRGVDFALARYNSNGTLDASFGTGGKVTTDIASPNDGAFTVAVRRDGKIVAAGRTFINGGFHSGLARYNSNGTLDATFGTGGKVTTSFGGYDDQVSSVAVQADGKIVEAGGATLNGGSDFALARYN
jgi:uncharacterized delta-60 repeat protein